MAAEWNDENTRILIELFVIQVQAGNQPSTHLTPNAFEDVAKDFKTRTSLEYTKAQLKNKWDKFKIDYNIFKKLKQRETGAGWDIERNTVKQDAQWWRKAKKDIPGCGKFKKFGLRNEDSLHILFEDITSDGTDHWNPASGSLPKSSEAAATILNVDAIEDLDLDETEEEAPPSAGKEKRLGRWIDDKNKKRKTCQVMQEQITRIGDLAERTQTSMESFIKEDDNTSVKYVMTKVVACGAAEGSDEYFIATELFVKREQREMFMQMSESTRFDWLRRKFSIKYGG